MRKDKGRPRPKDKRPRCARCEWLFNNGEPDSGRHGDTTYCCRCQEEMKKK